MLVPRGSAYSSSVRYHMPPKQPSRLRVITKSVGLSPLPPARYRVFYDAGKHYRRWQTIILRRNFECLRRTQMRGSLPTVIRPRFTLSWASCCNGLRYHNGVPPSVAWIRDGWTGLIRLTSGDVVLSGDYPQPVSLFCGPGGFTAPERSSCQASNRDLFPPIAFFGLTSLEFG